MDVITAIEKERGRYRVTVNESEDLLVPVSIMREQPLRAGQEIDLEDYDQWLMVRQYRHALDRAVAFLALRPRSTREVEKKLLQAGYRPCTVEMVLYKLEKEDILNDADFAKQWVAARSTHQLGKNRIARELRQKGIDTDHAENALEAIEEEDQLSGAISLAEKAAARTKPGEDRRKTVSRISAMLARRGYSWEIIKEAVDTALRGDSHTL